MVQVKASTNYLVTANIVYLLLHITILTDTCKLQTDYVFDYFAALIESDAEGIGGSGFVECIKEHIHSVCNFALHKVVVLVLQCFVLKLHLRVYSGMALSIDR